MFRISHHRHTIRRRLAPGFKKAENNFKPYFVGNIITLSSMLGLRRASPDGSLLIAPCRCGQAVQHCLNIIALSSMFGLRRASPDGSAETDVAGAGYFPTLLSPVLPLGLMFDVWEPKQAVVERSNEVCKRRSSCSGFVSCKKGAKS